MNLQFENEAGYENFLCEIGERLTALEQRTLEKPEFSPAAVLMPILNIDGEAHVLLTRRTGTVATHKGEVAFPGGKRDEDDENSLHTALRETEEEVGIAPADVRIIGEFDHYISIYGFHVSTFIGAIPYPYEYRINCDEIDDCMEVPLHIFRDEKFYKTEIFYYEGNEVKVYYYSYNGFEIWGLTARILTDFARKILQK